MTTSMEAARVLVVEDEGIIAADLAETLLRLGYQVTGQVGTGEEALLAVAAAPPDLVLLDVRLRGELDGLGVARSLRAAGSPAPPAVVFLTSHSDDVTLSGARDTGAYGHLLKPFRERELRGALETALGRLALERELAERDRIQKELEARVATAERLAALGTITAGVAHEVNNPMAAVNANLEYGLEHLDEVTRAMAPGEPARAALAQVREALRDALEAGQRVTRIVRDLRKLGRAEELAPSPLDVGAVVESALRLLVHEVGRRVRLEVVVGRAPLVRGDEGRLVQVLVNLVQNAVHAAEDARPGSGSVTVRTSTDARGWAVVTVSDDGRGIPLEVATRVFDPFFSTKDAGRGMGLGLTIARRVAGEHGGELTFTAAPAGGTVFRLALPPAAL